MHCHLLPSMLCLSQSMNNCIWLTPFLSSQLLSVYASQTHPEIPRRQAAASHSTPCLCCLIPVPAMLSLVLFPLLWCCEGQRLSLLPFNKWKHQGSANLLLGQGHTASLRMELALTTPPFPPFPFQGLREETNLICPLWMSEQCFFF